MTAAVANADADSEAGCGAFVVVCDARSGSGYLCGGLDHHPELACHHELFNPALDFNQYGLAPFARSDHSDPIAYLAELRARTQALTGARLVGFKLHFRHHPAVLDYVLGDRAHRVVLLVRRDKLAQWGSYQLASFTGEWRLPENRSDRHPVQRVHFRLRRFFAFLVHQTAWENAVLQRRPDCLRVCYEDIVPPGSLDRVLSYLGVDPQVDVGPSSGRQFNGDSTLDRFNNPTWARFGASIAKWLARGVDTVGLTASVQRLTHY